MRSESAAFILQSMFADFREKGTFGEVGNFLAGKDEYFGFGDWLRVFRTVPSLRRYLPLALLWNGIAKPRERTGYSERYLPGRKYNFAYRSFCTDFLVWESAVRAAAHFALPLPDRAPAELEAYFSLARDNCYPVEYGGRVLPMYSYYPRRDHRVDPRSEVFRLFFSRDDNVPDIDTTCLILGSCLTLMEAMRLPASAYRHDGTETNGLLDLMADHVHGAGAYGRGSLSYLNGVGPDDRGVLTWVFDHHNELDPTSNVNILNYLFRIRSVHPGAPADRIEGLSRGILRFLANHARQGDLLDQRFQSYYPLGPSVFFWRRLALGWAALDPGMRARLDPEGDMARIDAYMVAETRRLFSAPPRPFHDYDFLACAPFLYERGVLRERIRDWLGDAKRWMEHFRDNHYEIFHLRYPSKIICAPIHIPSACLLDLLTLVDKDAGEVDRD